MTIDGLLTFLALVVAVVAVIPSAMRRAMDLKFGLWERFAIITSFIVVLFLEYYDTFKELFHTPSIGFAQKYHLTPQSSAFAVVLFCGLFVVAAVRLKPIPTRRMKKLQRLIETLVEGEQFAEVIEILSPCMAMICDIHVRRYGQFGKKGKRECKNARAASDIIRILFLSPKMVQFIARSKPYVAVEMLKGNLLEIPDFLAMYIHALMIDRHSIIYFEVKQNQNVSTSSGYEFPSSNRLLCFLFGNAKNAERLDLSVPIGDFLMTGPASPEKEENRVFLNREMRDFQRNEQWSHPWFVGIRLYDLMVTAALHQNVQWHMGLYDFCQLTEALLRAHDEHSPKIDPDAEFPTVGHYLIYEMFSAMRSWIRGVDHLPSGQENIKLENKKFDHENGNIPKSTIMVMVMCLKEVIVANNISDKFKRYLLSIVLSTYESTRVRKTLQTCGYAEMMLNTIRDGDFWEDPDVPVYRRRLLQLLPEIDMALKPEVVAVKGAIREAIAQEGSSP